MLPRALGSPSQSLQHGSGTLRQVLQRGGVGDLRPATRNDTLPNKGTGYRTGGKRLIFGCLV